jgi:4-hydroxy-tetrahydrodipicolinate synthase
MFIETSPGPVKTAMNHLGLAAGPLRLPLVAMENSNRTKLLAVLAESGINKLS